MPTVCAHRPADSLGLARLAAAGWIGFVAAVRRAPSRARAIIRHSPCRRRHVCNLSRSHLHHRRSDRLVRCAGDNIERRCFALIECEIEKQRGIVRSMHAFRPWDRARPCVQCFLVAALSSGSDHSPFELQPLTPPVCQIALYSWPSWSHRIAFRSPAPHPHDGWYRVVWACDVNSSNGKRSTVDESLAQLRARIHSSTIMIDCERTTVALCSITSLKSLRWYDNSSSSSKVQNQLPTQRRVTLRDEDRHMRGATQASY